MNNSKQVNWMITWVEYSNQPAYCLQSCVIISRKLLAAELFLSRV